MTARRVAALLVAACVVYLLLITQRAWVLLSSGEVLAILLGVGLLVVPIIGGWVVWREVQFGLQAAVLADVMAADGSLPVDDLPRRPSGRPERAAADARFAQRKQELEQEPSDWRGWYRLGLAYDDAGDRRRAREAVRRAISLHASTN